MEKAQKRIWITFALCVLVICVVLIIVSFFIPLYPEICSKNEYTNQKECFPQYIAVFMVRYLGEAIEAHNGAIVAFATIFIAWFTYQLRAATIGLKNSTDKLWEAGEAQRRVSESAVEAANEANKISRQTGQAQVRAYLTCSAAIYRVSSIDVSIYVSLTNVGNSPAQAVSVSGELHLAILETLDDQMMPSGEFNPEMHISSAEPRSARFQAIHAGATHTGDVKFSWPTAFERGSEITESESDVFFEWNAITFAGEVKWTDVFGTVETFPVFITNDFPATEAGIKMTRTDSGSLNVFMKDNSK